eukprot:9096296-Ditylum_brightwellii.AAC.1
MHYHITTAFGIATIINFFGFIATVFGIGQGSTTGPPGWTSGQPLIIPEEELLPNTIFGWQRDKDAGCHQTATLDKSEELDYLLNKTTTYNKVTSVCLLHPHEMWLGYMTVYKPCIMYPPSTTSFYKAQVKILHTACVSKVLPYLGYNCTFPSEVVFGSKYSRGIGLMHVSAAQLGAKVYRAIKYVWVQTKTGKKFIMMTQWAQISASTCTPILEETWHLSYLEGRWLKQLLLDMQSIQCKIHLVDPWMPVPH